MVVKAINNIAKLDNLVLILLVFRVYPWINKNFLPLISIY
jgi:hypothetical protein